MPDSTSSRSTCAPSPTSTASAAASRACCAYSPTRTSCCRSGGSRTPDVARESAAAIRARFDEYLAAGDLVGADMARKFLQMGYTRSRRYANHPGGRKYDGPVPTEQRGNSGAHGRRELPRGPEDADKAESARVFKEAWDAVEQVAEYTQWRTEHRSRHG